MTTKHAWSRREVLASGLTAVAAIGASGVVGADTVTKGLTHAGKGALPVRITDGQVHIWQPGGKTPSASGRQTPFSAEQLLRQMDDANVDRAVIVTPSWSVHGNDYALASARKYPDRLRVMGLCRFPGPEDKTLIEGWNDSPGMAGMSMFLSFPQGAEWLSQGKGDWLWPMLEDQHIPLMIQAGDSLPELASIARKHPGLKLCLGAFGLPTNVHGAKAAEAFAPVAELAKYPNVVIKTGAIPFMSEQAYPYADIQRLLRRAYDAFGPNRLIFASDITLLKVPYKTCVDFWTEIDWLSDRERQLIMNDNITNWLNWPVSA